MRTMRYAALLSLALATMLSGGCDDSGVTAPTDGTILVSASPGTITIDPNRLIESPPGSGIFVPESQGTSTIVARLRDAAGNAVEGVSLFFSTTGGTLASAGGSEGVRTNANGIAQDVLTVRTLDPSSVDVTASSGSISGEVTVVKVVGTLNRPPAAVVVITPTTEQGVNLPVRFDGSTSSDPDGDAITMYRWTVFSTNPDPPGTNPFVLEARDANAFVRSYANLQSLSGTLQITDDPRAPGQKDRGETIVYRSTAAFTYRIVSVVCGANTAPLAVIAGPATVQAAGAVGTPVTVTLDGTLSSDTEGPVTAYVWSCGSDSDPVPVPGTSGARVQCTYTVLSTARNYQATLVVRDAGTGVANPDGSYPCQKSSTQVSVSVAVSPTATPGP